MDEYRINLLGSDIDDKDLQPINNKKYDWLEIIRKGEIYRKKTGQKYEVNYLHLLMDTTQEEIYEKQIDEIISLLENDQILKEAFLHCKEIELQFWIRIRHNDEEYFDGGIHIRKDQINYLSEIGAHIDVNIIGT